MSATASFDADDSSSIHSGCNVDIEAEKDSQTTENGNGTILIILLISLIYFLVKLQRQTRIISCWKILISNILYNVVKKN